jgi:hypothetical protein
MSERNNGFERSPQSILELDVTPEKLIGIDRELGKGGIGTFLIPNVLDTYQIQYMQQEIFDPHKVAWRDNHQEYVNGRGMTIKENHTSFALKLHHGDQSLVEQVPAMRALATNIEELIISLSVAFPNLRSWQADEMSLHRYDDQEVGLSYHKDNLQYTGLIAVLTLEGASDFAVKDANGVEYFYPVSEGDLMLTRATDLYPEFGPTGKPINLCPDHAVLNLKSPYRMSFIVRANSQPDRQIPGFEYANWKQAA